MNRRFFLKTLGFGVGAAAVIPTTIPTFFKPDHYVPPVRTKENDNLGLIWEESVETLYELPKTAESGQVHYVESKKTVYIANENKWWIFSKGD